MTWRLALVQLGQPVEGLVDRDDVQPLLLEVVHHRVERHAPPAPAAAVGGPPPRVVDEHLPHGPRRRREQVAPVRRLVEDRLAQQPDHGLVDHRGGREGVVGPLPPHQARGDPAQLVIDQREELTPGPLVPGPGPSQDERQIPAAARPPSPLRRKKP